jgi:hypothetical protein
MILKDNNHKQFLNMAAPMIIEITEWIQFNRISLFWLGIGSVLIFMVALIGMPFLVVRMPADYFSTRRRSHKILSNLHPVLYVFFWVGKNMLGIVFILAGMIMLVLPGQGVLTIVAGILLLNFPGKFRLARWIVKRSPIRKTLNWFRRRAGKNPFILD